jgi:hypothetical protein
VRVSAIWPDFQAEPFVGAPLRHGTQNLGASTSRRNVFILLGAIIAIALAARMVMACLLSDPCNDAYFYFCIADLLTMQKHEQAFTHLNLNTYPAILAALHSCGLDWVTAGKLWGVTASTLTVLPLFGWARRLWGDRIALVAALLYAVHPEMIELGVEPIREPTFWLFFALGLYAIDRAFGELKWRFFCLAGIATTLAFYTRTEGLVLLIVLGIGASVALFQHKNWKRRLKIVGGITLCLSMTPMLLVAVNVSLLRNHAHWEFGRLNHVSYLATAVWPGESSPAESSPGESTPAAQVVAPTAVNVVVGEATENGSERVESSTAAVPATKSFPARCLKFVSELNGAYGPLNFVLFVIGAVTMWRHRLLHYLIPLMIPSAAVMGAVWIRLAAGNGGINGRYFLTMFFLIAPVFAVGLLSVMRYISARPWGWSRGAGRLMLNGPTAATVMLTLITAILIADALTSKHDRRSRDLQIASQLVERYGPFDHVIVDHHTARIGYAAQRRLPETLAFTELMESGKRPGTGLIIVSRKGNDPLWLIDLEGWVKYLRYEEIDSSELSVRRNDLIVYIKMSEVASVPTGSRH